MVKLVTVECKPHWMIDFSPIAFVMVAADIADFAQLKEDMEVIMAKAAGPEIIDTKKP